MSNVTKMKNKKKSSVEQDAARLQNMIILDDLIEQVSGREGHLPGIVGFSGPSGFGKSTAAAWIASQGRAHYVSVASTWTKRALLEAILAQTGTPPAKIVHQCVKQAADDLAVSQNILIIDEFDNAIDRGLVEVVRDIYEMSKSPILIIGEERMPLKLQKWERFHGRVMEWAQAQPADMEDARILNRHYVSDVEVADDLLEVLVDAANGSVRRIVTNLDRIARQARDDGKKKIDLAGWGGRELHTGAAPKVREY